MRAIIMHRAVACYLTRCRADIIWKCYLTSAGIPIIEMRRCPDRLIFMMEFAMLEKTVFILRRGPDVWDKIYQLPNTCTAVIIEKPRSLQMQMQIGIIRKEHYETLWMGHQETHQLGSDKSFTCQRYITGLILGLRLVNERRCYFVTTSLIGWAQAYNQPCISNLFVLNAPPPYFSLTLMPTDLSLKW